MRNGTAVRLTPELEFRIQKKKSFLGAVACVLDRVVDCSESCPFNSFVMRACIGKLLEESKCHRRLKPTAGALRRRSNKIAVRVTGVQNAGYKIVLEERKKI